MSLTTVDSIIVGQGLAGTVLAWQLVWRGQKIAVIDDPQPKTASRIAAGLITPITGQRLVPSWRFDEFWPAAVNFYRQAEAQTGKRFFREIAMVRLFKNEDEKARLKETAKPDLRFPEPLVNEADFHNPFGGFEMTGGRLDVPEFLAASKEWLKQAGAYRSGTLDLPGEVGLHKETVAIPKFGVKAKRVLFCEGFRALENSWFGGVPFDPAKGDILTVRVPGLTENRVIHRGIWLAPLEDELFRVGATYNREQFDAEPTETGREELCRQLASFLKRPFEVIDHRAAVRPIVLGRHPAIGLHPRIPALGYFNGLASKGSLQAPFIAEQFARFLTGDGEIDEELNVQQRFGPAIWNDE